MKTFYSGLIRGANFMRFQLTLSRPRTNHCRDGARLILQASANEFFVAGAGLTVSFARDPDV